MFMLITGTLFGVLYVQTNDHTQTGVNNRIGAMFATMLFCSMPMAEAALPVLFRQRGVFYREKAAHTYSPSAYSLSIVLSEFPYVIIAVFLLVVPFYFMIGFSTDPAVFFKYILGMVMVCLSTASTGIVVAAASPTQPLALVIQLNYITLYYMFGGILVPGPSVPAGWKWFYELNPMRQGLELLVTAVYECTGSDCATILTTSEAGQQVQSISDWSMSHFGLSLQVRDPLSGCRSDDVGDRDV